MAWLTWIFPTFSGLISPGVSVPVQVPGGVPSQDPTSHMPSAMGSMTSQYWPRMSTIQWRQAWAWTCDTSLVQLLSSMSNAWAGQWQTLQEQPMTMLDAVLSAKTLCPVTQVHNVPEKLALNKSYRCMLPAKQKNKEESYSLKQKVKLKAITYPGPDDQMVPHPLYSRKASHLYTTVDTQCLSAKGLYNVINARTCQ